MYTLFKKYGILLMKGGFKMAKITLSEIVSDYINDKKVYSPKYGIKSFASQCNLSRSFIHRLVEGQYENSFSDKVIDSIASTIKIKKEFLIQILSSDNGKEMYVEHTKLIHSINEILERSDTDQLKVYYNLICTVENKI